MVFTNPVALDRAYSGLPGKIRPDGNDLDRVWDTVLEDLQPLCAELEKLV